MGWWSKLVGWASIYSRYCAVKTRAPRGSLWFTHVHQIWIPWPMAIKQKGTPSECSCFHCSLTHALTVSTWHICSCASIDCFCLASLQWLNKNKTKTAKQQNYKTQPSATTPPWGVQYILLFLFFGFLVFLVSCFLVSCFLVRCWFLKGWQNNTKVKDLDLTRCQFSHFRGCKLAFGCFIVCFGRVVPLENHIKTMAKCRYHRRKLGGVGTQIRQFGMFMYWFKKCLKFEKCKNIGSQWMCRTDFDTVLTLLGQTLKLTHVQTI